MKAGKLSGIWIMTIGVIWFFSASTSFAIPSLQLDIEGGTYDVSTETIISSGPAFTLHAYTTNNISVANSYFLSAALIGPGISNSQAGLGSFTIDATTYAVTGAMIYGVPPAPPAPGLLPTHSIFPTWFLEIPFSFSSGNSVPAYNTADGTPGPGIMYDVEFAVNVTALDADYNIHFDLYSYQWVEAKGNKPAHYELVDKAPFSHDAESHRVPEPGSLLLLGAGLVGFGILGRRKFRS